MASRHLIFEKQLTDDDVRLKKLLIPPGHGREYFQKLSRGRAIPFRDNWGKSWIVTYDFFTFRSRRYDVLSGEWQTFVEAKNLQVNDTLTFEFECGLELRFYVSVSRGVSSSLSAPVLALVQIPIRSARTRPILAQVHSNSLPFKGVASLVDVLWRTFKGAASEVEGLIKALVHKGSAGAASERVAAGSLAQKRKAM